MSLKFYRSTIGKKVTVALTGIVLLLFVIGHMAGNLKVFGGYESSGVHKLDRYAEFLREMGAHVLGHAGLLWLMRIGLLVCLILHVVTVIQLQALNAKSRPVPYGKTRSSAAGLASKSMYWGGLLLFVFIVVHLLHLTFGKLPIGTFREGAVYANVYSAFKIWYVTLLYVIAMIPLALHMYHGAWSVFQTLGLDNPAVNLPLRLSARVVSVAVALGFCALPLSIYFDILPPPIIS